MRGGLCVGMTPVAQSLLIAHGEGSLRVNTARGQRGGASASGICVIPIVLHRERDAVDAAGGTQKPLMRGARCG